MDPTTAAATRRRAATAVLVVGLATCCIAVAQTDASYPPTAPAPAPSAKQLFANTLAAVAQTAGTVLVANLQHGLTDWFNRKLGSQAVAGAYAAPASNDPAPYGTQAAADAGTHYYDPGSGQPVAAEPYASAPDAGAALYAGLAYEIHRLLPGGATQPVDPASHEFGTGDRFVVYYRPTLPGQVLVYNVNPLGRETLIDEAAVAAGDLARLGPYEFAATRGDELLRLVLRPCSTPVLAGATRDIVRVSDAAALSAAAPGGPPLEVATCATVATRALGTTRDIRKVAVDGTTGYALDALSAQEVASGEIGAREITIALRHR